MDFDFSAEQYTLRDESRRFLDEQCPPSHVREHIDDPAAWSRDLWKRMCDLGWTALSFPSSVGGLDMSFLDVTLLLGELGRAVAPVPFFSTIAAGQTILLHGSEQQKQRWLPAIARGEKVAAFACGDPSVPSRLTVTDGRLSGSVGHVLDVAAADLFVVAANDAWHVVDEGFTVQVRRGLDLTRSIGTVTFDNAQADTLEVAGLQPGFGLAVAGFCAEMVGTGQRILDESVAYAKVREQFGRPIGSFQAIKHKCAEMATDVEASKAAAYYACWAASSGAPDMELACSVAKSFVSESLARVGGEGVQTHGGIAFTWEHDMHLFLKRIKSAEALLGDAAYHRERILDIAGL